MKEARTGLTRVRGRIILELTQNQILAISKWYGNLNLFCKKDCGWVGAEDNSVCPHVTPLALKATRQLMAVRLRKARSYGASTGTGISPERNRAKRTASYHQDP